MSNSLTFFEVTGNFYAVANPSLAGVTNELQVQPINALATFTPRLLQGQLIYISDYLVTEAYNAEQTVNVLGEPVSGTWTLQFGSDITSPLPWDATPSQVQTALRALPSIGSGNVNVVADIEPLAYDVEFTGALGDQAIPVLIGNADLLVNDEGPGFCEITVAPTALGSPTIIADTAIALPVITARIFGGVLCTIDRVDTPGVQLTANTQILGLGNDLIYDVAFSNITFNEASQVLAPFAFLAPLDGSGVDLSDPALKRLKYQSPSKTMWYPGGETVGSSPSLMLVGGQRNWRQRAAG